MAYQNPGKREGSPEWNTNSYESRGRQNRIIIPAETPDSKQPVYPVLSSRQILPTTLPPKNYAVSRQRSTSRELLTSSRKFLNLIHDGSKFCLAPGDVTQDIANEYGKAKRLFINYILLRGGGRFGLFAHKVRA